MQTKCSRFFLLLILLLTMGTLGCQTLSTPTQEPDSSTSSSSSTTSSDPNSSFQTISSGNTSVPVPSQTSNSLVGLDGEVISGTSTTGTTADAPTTPSTSSSGAKKLDVPILNQMANQVNPDMSCAPTSAAMVMRYYGKNVTPDEISQMTGANPNGTYLDEIAVAAKKLGFSNATVRTQGSLADLEQAIAGGNPVIITANVPTPHAMVVKGFDANGNVLINDPSPPTHDLVMTRSEFYNQWHAYNQREYLLLK